MIPIKDENPTRSFPLVTICVIAINIAVFIKYNVLMSASGFERLIYKVALIPQQYSSYGITNNIKPLLTHMFFHADFFHLAGNMLYLWIFGNNVEDALGKVRFIIFYLMCGYAAATLQTMMHPSAVIPMIGASGAIAGVLGAYFILYPRARVLVVFPVIIFLYFFWIPAPIILIMWFLIQLINGYAGSMASKQAGGVAWFAHIGGFVFGAALIYPALLTKMIFKRKRR